MFKVGDKVKYTGNSPVFPKDGVYEVESSNSHFFVVQGLCFNQEGKHWTLEQSIKVGDWVVSPSDKGVHQYESWMKNTICTKVSIDNHPHKEVMLAYAEGKKIQYYTEAVAAWSDCNSPSFYLADKYRVKPDFEAGDWVTDKVGCLFKTPKGMSGFGYCKATNHRHWDVAQAWDKSAIVQLKTLKDKWKDVVTPIFDPYTEYRIKPSFKVGDWCVHGDSHRLITNITLGDVKFKGEVWSHALEDCEPMAPGHKHWETMQAWANGAEVESTRHGDVWLGLFHHFGAMISTESSKALE